MTIYDIAKEANVAASTVSRVINNKPGISPKTREKVECILEKYNFIPDAAARGLVMQSTKIVGILIEDIRVSHHTNSAYVIEQELTKQGYCCITMNTGVDSKNKAKHIRLLEERRVEGVVLMGSMFATEEVKESVIKYLKNVPIVIVNGYLDLPNVSGVVMDEAGGVKEAVHCLWNKGKHKIAFLLDSHSPANYRKRDGYCKGMRAVGATEEDLLIYEAKESTWQGGYDSTVLMLQENPDLQGIIYTIDLVATSGVRAAVDRGLSIPKDIAIVGIDNSAYGQICIPQLTTVDSKAEDVSRIAAQILVENLMGSMESKCIEMSAELVERETT
ncbi:LacI family DNA-binding transcriptional regulator [Chakrabartyella piscis]|uniref:LacI family DNA-binding transcriptional regulator n=1 Tax=Chakrabartyella piscis TaxID=2918914 RepID=UPI002958772A|nr:LacI family DNA-binding transcriptional regulator [Chakrabartyella piscis]